MIIQTDVSDKVWSAALKKNYNTMEKKNLPIIRGIKKWRLLLLPKLFKVLIGNKPATTFVRQVLDDDLIRENFIGHKLFYLNLAPFMSMF